MADKIEIYIKSENVVISQGITRPVADHSCTDRMLSRTERVVSERDQIAIEIAEEFANKKGLSVDVYNINSAKGKLMARLRHVKTTPTIIIGQSRIEGEFTSNQLKSKLQSCTVK
jgi:protein-disulfide isomerase